MAREPERGNQRQISAEQQEYRRRAEIKAKRRRKRRMQKIMLLGSFVLAAVLLVLCIVMVVRAFLKPKPQTNVKSSSSISSIAPLQEQSAVSPVAPDPNRWELLLINKASPMPDGFNPETVGVSSAGHQFDARASQSLLEMIAACNNASEGNSLAVFSANRGAETQNKKYSALVDLFKSQGDSQEAAEEKASEIEPPYPLSDHQTALGVDFITNKVTETAQAFAETPEYTWLIEHAAEYGFILRFPETKSEITGISYQPYHFRYVGVEDAKIISQAGICLEEYVRQLPVVPPANDSSSSMTSSASQNEV